MASGTWETSGIRQIIEDREARMGESDLGVVGREKATKSFAIQVENLILRAGGSHCNI